ncbi:hypothetical protein [Tahibacter amnicola]|uniref:HTH cro/C1-type domain-containing protein n=1 Tax=Tahibacter amnicola TaxID=2976241 RepID=A0ABY6BPN5_9GAMM|nr:hypothetical protein [Tahibacter amnicola]UXI70375.1 hypothetical protein N4264_12295 [Tahibacter amnicola]
MALEDVLAVDFPAAWRSVRDPLACSLPAMPPDEFADLLSVYMRRIRASASGVATEIGMSREAVNNWRQGLSLPNRKHRHKLVECARYLRLSEQETDRLLAAAGFESQYPMGSQSTGQPFGAHITGLFERLSRMAPYPILMLLSQAHWGQPPFRDTLLATARRVYGDNAVLHVRPPYSVTADAKDYFEAIGSQCGLAGVDSDFAFEAALERRLASGERLFCLVSRFEQGDPALREALAGILRSLSEMYSGRLHLMLCGGDALAALKYQSGDLSLLNIATVEYWPDPGNDELLDLARVHLPEGMVTAALAARLSSLCGGHPALIEEALVALAQQPAIDDAALLDRLCASSRLWEAFVPLVEDEHARLRVRGWLMEARLGRAQPYLLDATLRRLFWANLLAVRQDGGAWLEWRCEAVRRAGRSVIDG